jgi:predicted enzyme related to lactoylglutathione lyase
VLRENSALKLSFHVTSIERARQMVAEHGGCVYSAGREWNDGSRTVCDGWDRDGNVLQIFTARRRMAPDRT